LIFTTTIVLCFIAVKQQVNKSGNVAHEKLNHGSHRHLPNFGIDWTLGVLLVGGDFCIVGMVY
jgi:hypothetical protein